MQDKYIEMCDFIKSYRKITEEERTVLDIWLKKKDYKSIEKAYNYMQEVVEKDALIFKKSTQTYNQVINKFTVSKGRGKATNVLVVRPTGLGKSYLLAKISGDKYLRETDEDCLNMSFYLYPTDIIKQDMIKKYRKGGSSDVRLIDVIFCSYKRIGSIIYTLNNATAKTAENGDGYKFYVCQAKYNNEYMDDIYEIISNPSATDRKHLLTKEPITISTAQDLRDFFETYIGMIMLDECHKAGSETFRKFWYTLNFLAFPKTNGWSKKEYQSGAKGLNIAPEQLDFGTPGFAQKYRPNGPFVATVRAVNRKVIGVTATPFRIDSNNPRTMFGNVLEKYTLGDAIRDKYLQKFDYVYTTFDKAKVIESAKKAVQTIKSRRIGKQISLSDSDISTIERIVNDSCRNSIGDTIKECINDSHKLKNHLGQSVDYIKLIMFFTDTAELANSFDDVCHSISKAYKNYKVTPYICVTDNNRANIETSGDNPNSSREYSKKGKLVATDLQIMDNNTQPRDKHIDLIFSVDMLNMGYHVDDITGVVVFNNTTSAVVFNQQIGRCFSVKSMSRPIIFDVVDNAIEQRIEKKDVKGSGYKKNISEILDSDNVDDLYNEIDTTKGLADSLRSVIDGRESNYSTVKWLYEMRGASPEVIADMLGTDIEYIQELCSEFNG